MIEYLNHHMISWKSILNDKWPKAYKSFKCIKCNAVIFNVDNGYFMYDNGKDDYLKHGNWHFLELSCEEETIKKLLE